MKLPRFTAFALVILTVALGACNKEAKITGLEDLSYEERLEGIWVLTAVSYESEIPDFSNPLQTIEIEGEGEDVEGLFVLGHDPNKMDYEYAFTANISLIDSMPPIPLPVEREGRGTWSSTTNESRIFVTEDDGTNYTFEVIENSLNRQVYQTTFEETIMSIFTIEVDVELTFTRQ